MNFGQFIIKALVVGIITFATGILVSLLFNLIIHGNAAVAWGAMFRLGVILGIVLPLTEWLYIKKG